MLLKQSCRPSGLTVKNKHMLGEKERGMGKLEGERREEGKVGEKKGVTLERVLSVASLIVSVLAFGFFSLRILKGNISAFSI